MPFSPKEAAESLMKLADTLENEAMNVSYMVCNKCRHTASLSTINGKRVRVASELNVKNVNTVTVNDKVSCPACDGTMSYVATEKSSRYYVESAEAGPLEIAPPTDTPSEDPALLPPEEDKKKELKKAPVDNGDIFDPVDEQGDKKNEGLDLGFGDEGVDNKKPEDMPPSEGAPEDMPPPEGAPEDMPPPEGKPEDMPPPEGTPEDMPPPEDKLEGKPEDMPSPEGTSEDMPPPEGGVPGEGPGAEMPPVMEEEVPLDEPKKKSKKKDKVEFPKEDVPKFEKMPKEASDSGRLYEASLKKYMF